MRAFGLAQACGGDSNWSIDWFRDCRELIVPADYMTRAYFDQWLLTVAAQMIDAGYLTLAELQTRSSAFVPQPSDPPATAQEARAYVKHARSYAVGLGTAPQFAKGDAVRGKTMGHSGHTRLPPYVRGRSGTVFMTVLMCCRMRQQPARPEENICTQYALMLPSSGRRCEAARIASSSIFGRAILKPSEPGLGPLRQRDGEPLFGEPWHAQVSAMASLLVASGTISALQWADALGAELHAATLQNSPDDSETYYQGVLSALEHVLNHQRAISREELALRREEWERAYLQTPHGQPVVLR